MRSSAEETIEPLSLRSSRAVHGVRVLHAPDLQQVQDHRRIQDAAHHLVCEPAQLSGRWYVEYGPVEDANCVMEYRGELLCNEKSLLTRSCTTLGRILIITVVIDPHRKGSNNFQYLRGCPTK